MKFYFIRHAPTSANSSGSMVPGYENIDISSYDKPEDWEEKVGKHIPDNARRFIVSSPTRRCISTARMLFDRLPMEVCKCLGEFDCKALGSRKFWEIPKEEFEKFVPLRPGAMEKRALEILHDMGNTVRHENNTDSVICISHGIVIRYLYHFMTGNPGISLYDVINSTGFKFSNLDLLIIDTSKKTAEVYRYKEPIDHANR